MKTSVHKLIKSWLNKTNIYISKKKFDKKTIIIGIVAVSILLIISYFLRPITFDYVSKKETLENKIVNVFNLKTNIKGKISYKALPSPRILIENIILDFGKDKIKINEAYILISTSKLKNIDELDLKKFYVLNQNIKIYSTNLKKLFQYFTLQKNRDLVFKNSKIIFVDEQKNELNFNNFNLKDISNEEKHEIDGNLNFSKNRININFLNKIASEKFLKISIPNLNQNLDINFDKGSNLDNLSGELKLKMFDSILLLNFNGKDNFVISKSYLRNKFLNSKIDGEISFKDQFNFNLNFDINQINLRKLLLYYSMFQIGVSKKINGKINVLIKNSDSLFGKIKNVNLRMSLENGDIRITNLSAILPENTKIKSDISILANNVKPQIQFKTNFSSSKTNKFLRKFGIYDFDKNETSIYASGVLDLSKNKIKFQNIIKNKNEKIGKNQLSALENSFNTHILKDGVLGIFDFFKVKKFILESN